VGRVLPFLEGWGIIRPHLGKEHSLDFYTERGEKNFHAKQLINYSFMREKDPSLSRKRRKGKNPLPRSRSELVKDTSTGEAA